MTDRPYQPSRGEQFLGEIETEIAGTQYYDAQLQPGEHVNLERELENEQDRHAIRVENGRFQPVGHLPRRLVAWLSPLIDSGQVRIDGYVPAARGDHEPGDPASRPLVLMVFLAPKGEKILLPVTAETKLEALHGTVLQAYRQTHGLTDPQAVLEVSERLQPLAAEELLPQTQLLLALIPGICREVRAARSMQTLAVFRDRLGQLIVGTPLACAPLTVFPLFWPDPDDPPYVLLAAAIENGTAVVEEISQAGSVPSLRLHNQSLRPLLVVEGEILVGAKQNRVVNLTVLVAAKSTFTLPVSCVEQGRWQYRSPVFTSQFYAPPSLRNKKLRSVQRNRQAAGQAHSDQGEVWQEVHQALAAACVRSATASLTDGLDRHRQRCAANLKRLELPEDTAGVLVSHHGQIVGLDLFDAPATLSAFWPRLAEAYLFGAHRRPAAKDCVSVESAQRFVQAIAERARARHAALGLGEELEIAGDGPVGSALLYRDGVCHLAAFAQTP